MSASYQTTRRVQFAETDAAGIIHFAAYFNMMEEAEHAWRRQLGHSVMTRDEVGVVSWPRAAASCQFRHPVKFEDELDIEVRLTRLGNTSLTCGFTFSHQGRCVAEGEMTSVCCRIVEGRPPKPMPIPGTLRALLNAT